MAGLLDFLGGIFGGGQQQQSSQPAQAGGLTDPALYAQQPPEFHLPFAYKLAMLGSSINRSYGGRGGMDVGGLAEAYMQNQKTQYDWQVEQAEKKRKLELVDKYLEKSGNTQLREMCQADPDACIKHIFGIEAEKAKPHERKVTNADGVVVDNETGEVIYAPKPKDYRYLVEGGDPAAPAAPATMTVPSVGVARAAAGDRAPDAAATATMTTVPVPTAPVVSEFKDIDMTGVSGPGQTTIKTLKANLELMTQPIDRELFKLDQMQLRGDIETKDYTMQRRELLGQRKDAIDKAYDDMRTAANEDRSRIAAETAAEAERKAKEFVKVSAGETITRINPDTNKAEVIYKAEQAETTDIRNARLLADPDTPESLKTALREAMRSGTPLAPSAESQLAVIKGKLQLESTQKIAEANIDEGNKAAPVLGTLKTIETLIPGMTGGVLKDPNAIPAAFIAGWNQNADIIRKSVAYIAPQLRVIGSGSSSDPDVRLNLASLADWKDSREVNAAIIAMAIGRSKIAMDRSDLATQYNSGDISMKDFYAKMREINNRDITPQLIKDMLADGRLKREEPPPVLPGGAAAESITNKLKSVGVDVSD